MTGYDVNARWVSGALEDRENVCQGRVLRDAASRICGLHERLFLHVETPTAACTVPLKLRIDPIASGSYAPGRVVLLRQRVARAKGDKLADSGLDILCR